MNSYSGFTTDDVAAPAAGPFPQILVWFRAQRAERQRKATIARELATYTDRQLFDLGIQRADVPAIVKGTYRR